MDLTKLTRNDIRHARDEAFTKLNSDDSMVVYDAAEELANKIAGLKINDAIRILAAIGERLVDTHDR